MPLPVENQSCVLPKLNFISGGQLEYRAITGTKYQLDVLI